LLGDWDGFDAVQFRHLYGSIRINDEEVGAIELQEFEVAFSTRRREFFESLDDYSFDAMSTPRVPSGRGWLIRSSIACGAVP